jgi:hypothetical protein
MELTAVAKYRKGRPTMYLQRFHCVARAGSSRCLANMSNQPSEAISALRYWGELC